MRQVLKCHSEAFGIFDLPGKPVSYRMTAAAVALTVRAPHAPRRAATGLTARQAINTSSLLTATGNLIATLTSLLRCLLDSLLLLAVIAVLACVCVKVCTTVHLVLYVE